MFCTLDISRLNPAVAEGINRVLFGEKSEEEAYGALLAKYQALQEEMREVAMKLSSDSPRSRLITSDMLTHWRTHYGITGVHVGPAKIDIKFGALTMRYLSEFVSDPDGYPPIYIGLYPTEFDLVFAPTNGDVYLKNNTKYKRTLSPAVSDYVRSKSPGHAHCSVDGPVLKTVHLCTGGNDFYTSFKGVKSGPDLSLAVLRTHKWLNQVNYHDCYHCTHLDFELREQRYTSDVLAVATHNISYETWRDLFLAGQTWLTEVVRYNTYLGFYPGQREISLSDRATSALRSMAEIANAINLPGLFTTDQLPAEYAVSRFVRSPINPAHALYVWHLAYSVLLLKALDEYVIPYASGQLAAQLTQTLCCLTSLSILQDDWNALPKLRDTTLRYVDRYSPEMLPRAKEILT